MTITCGALVLLVALALVSEVYVFDYNTENDYEPLSNEEYILSYGADEEYYPHIHSMMAAPRSDMTDGRLVIGTNALVDTKYKTWKRNADMINSLLALPKGMNDAGR